MSGIRQNFHVECETELNTQANRELASSYFYLSVAYHFDRDDVALGNFHTFFSKWSVKKRDDAEKIFKLINERGGRVVLKDIPTPENNFGSPVDIMKKVLIREKQENDCLLKLTQLAEKHGDEHLADFMEDHFLNQQVESIKRVAGYVRNLDRVGSGLGEFMFDQEILG